MPNTKTTNGENPKDKQGGGKTKDKNHDKTKTRDYGKDNRKTKTRHIDKTRIRQTQDTTRQTFDFHHRCEGYRERSLMIVMSLDEYI
jgi:hypothetical protein